MELGIIQHLQSFMETKLSAQTSLLSKSWYIAWSTRPNLVFNPSDFDDYNIYRYLDYVTKTVRRCIYLNLKVDKFQFSLYPTDFHSLYDHVDSLIVDVLKLRINVLHLDFRLFRNLSRYVLPAQVFANKYLTELLLSGCVIVYLDHVLCSNLRSLELFDVCIEENTLKDILLRCPFIQHLNLSSFVEGLTEINATEVLNLKTLIVDGMVFGWESTITSSLICGSFLNLDRLVLRNVNVDESFFTNISSSFPMLEDLTLESLFSYPTFKISSRSITSLSLNYLVIKMAELDVPNIRNFKFSGTHFTILSFTDYSNEWKSEISLYNTFGTIDLSKLEEFLIKLGQSKITLRLSIDIKSGNVAPERNIENFHLPAMEELIFCLANCEDYNFFVKCLLYCRPKLVSLHFCLDYKQVKLKTCIKGHACIKEHIEKLIEQRNQNGTQNTLSIQFMYKKLIEQKNQNGTQNSEVEEVNAELFEESLKQWQPVKTWSDDHGAATQRFNLKWRSLTPTYTIIKLVQYYHIQDYIDFLSQF